MISTHIKNINKTRQTRVLYIFSIFAIGALFLVLFLHSRLKEKYSNIPADYDGILWTQKLLIPVTIADTSNEQELGLSYTKELPKNAGKLFVFSAPGRYGFWMKDMHYPLDLVWIDKDFKIIAIDKGVLPESYPNVFYPPQDVVYVLEVNAGFSTINNLKINQLLTLVNN